MIGQTISHYRILSKLGEGGMGEVYLAQDMQLDRSVALKMLPVTVAADPQRMRRFIQEAKAASALNHPNILTIHEIGQVDSVLFIATEFIDGETLRQHMTNARMKLGGVLDVAIQVASALSAAHAAGIVHRDVKPENIMVRKDGYIKVLDFGLAKLSESQTTMIESQAPTQQIITTSPGTVMGTVTYMSPEQTRGLEVDARTDIWSLGVVLYEMLTGQVPFGGETTSDVIAAIIEREPVDLGRYNEGVPAELEWMVKRALRKDREDRYQTAKEMLTDLRSLKQRLEVEAEIERSVQPEVSGEATTARSSGEAVVSTVEEPAARSTSSAEYIVTEIKRHKKGAALALAAIVIVILGIAFGRSRFSGHNKSVTTPTPSSQALSVSKLTNTGKATDAAISPDGKYVVHVVYDNGQQSLWVRHVATGSNVQIVPPAEDSYIGLTFSRDGNYIYYTIYRGNGASSTLYQVPVLGGRPSKKIMADVWSSVAFSPDDKRLAFLRFSPNAESALIIANADGTGEQTLATRRLPDTFGGADNAYRNPTWSPDGKVIVSPVFRLDASGRYSSVVEVQVEGGAEKPISTQRWYNTIGQIRWLSDGSGLVMTARDKASSPRQVWHLSYPSGEARRITQDVNEYSSISLTTDSTALVTVQSDKVSNILVAPNGDASRAKQITSGRGHSTPTWTPDGKIIYVSNASGNDDIWVMEASGGNQRQLTFDAGRDWTPSVSGDGRYIVFKSDRAGAGLWRMDIDGSNPKQLTSGSYGYAPSCSPDGQWVVYNSANSGKVTLWKVSIDDGTPIQLTDKFSYWSDVSPDGKLIACWFEEGGKSSEQTKLTILPFEGGQPVKIFDIPPTVEGKLRWTPDGRAVTYIDTRGGVSNIWSQPLDGGPPKQFTDFKAGQIFSFDWSLDGKQLAFERGTETSDVVLINNFK